MKEFRTENDCMWDNCGIQYVMETNSEGMADSFMLLNTPTLSKKRMAKRNIPQDALDACYILIDNGYSNRQLTEFLSSHGHEITIAQANSLFEGKRNAK